MSEEQRQIVADLALSLRHYFEAEYGKRAKLHAEIAQVVFSELWPLADALYALLAAAPTAPASGAWLDLVIELEKAQIGQPATMRDLLRRTVRALAAAHSAPASGAERDVASDLARDNGHLREALKPFAELLARCDPEGVDCVRRGGTSSELLPVNVADILRARAALTEDRK